MQVFREVVEIKKHIHEKVALSRDTGDTSLSPIYDTIINSDHIFHIKSIFHINPQTFVAQRSKISDIDLPEKRLAFKSAVSEMKL